MLHYSVTWSAYRLVVFLVPQCFFGLLAHVIFYTGSCQVMYHVCLGILVAKILTDCMVPDCGRKHQLRTAGSGICCLFYLDSFCLFDSVRFECLFSSFVQRMDSL